MNLPTLSDMQQRRRATPKAAIPSRLTDEIRLRLEDGKRLAVFRVAVWKRDEGRCRCCGCLVTRTLALDPKRGEVHHLSGRRVKPEDRYTVARAVLVCARCHGKLQRREITVPVVKA